MNSNNKDQMHPEDFRNFVIFCVISGLLWFAFSVFISEPQKEALRRVKLAEAEITATQEQFLENSEDFASNIKPTQSVQPALPRGEVLTKSSRVKIDNGQIFGSISLTGGRIDDMALHGFFDTMEKKNNVILLSPKKTSFPRYIDYGWIAAKSSLQVPGLETIWSVLGNDLLTPETPVTLLWNNGKGLSFERVYSIDKNYMITVTRKVTNNSGEKITLYPYGLIAQKGLPPLLHATWISHEGPIGYMGDELAEISYGKLRKEPSQKFQASNGWTGITDKYWLTSLIPPQGQSVKYSFNYVGNGIIKKGPKKKIDEGTYQADFTGPAMVLETGRSGESQSHIFTGAKKVSLLAEYEEQYDIPNFNLAVNFGWFWFFSKPFFYALHFLGEFTGNFGIAIILLTIAIRSAVFPLTSASHRSFAKMKKVTPQVAKLRKIHGDDKSKLQEEIMKLYQSKGVNPMAGCLPIFMQIPIFFALYKVLFLTIEMRHAPFMGWIKDLSAPDPTSVFNLFGLIPWNPPDVLHIGAWPCMMLVAMLIQKKLNPPPQDPLQRDMAMYFPLMMTYVLSNFASGLVIYWTFSAYIGVIQQMIIMRSLDVPIYLFGQSAEEEEMDAAVDKGPAVHPLIEMAEDEVEDALFGDHEGEAENDQPQKNISPPKPKKKTMKKKKKK